MRGIDVPPLPDGFVQADAGRDGYVQAGHRTAHRQADKLIAALADMLAQTRVFPTHHEGDGAGQVAVENRLAGGIAGTDNPDPVTTEPVENPAGIGDGGERDTLRRTGSHLADRRPEAHCAVPWHYHRGDTCRIRGAQASAEVMRILDTVEDQQQDTPVGCQRLFDEVPEPGLVERPAPANFRHNALVARFAADLLETRAVC